MFLQALALCGLARPALPSTEARPTTTKIRPQHTKEVRALTDGLSIRTARWKWIVVHHSAIKHGNAAVYDRVHRERGMENGLAYHFVIGNGVDSVDGGIEIGARWRKQLGGGHVHREDLNETGIGICLIGNFEITRPTTKQIAALRELMDYLGGTVWGKKLRFTVHKEAEPGRTLCPGKNFPLSKLHAIYGRNRVPAVL